MTAPDPIPAVPEQFVVPAIGLTERLERLADYMGSGSNTGILGDMYALIQATGQRSLSSMAHTATTRGWLVQAKAALDQGRAAIIAIRQEAAAAIQDVRDDAQAAFPTKAQLNAVNAEVQDIKARLTAAGIP